jgi:glutamate-1-semialdehyde 2,1-aminomutase
MIGHSPPAVVDAIEKQMRNGLTFMLPSEDSLWVANDMKRRFGLQYWQFTLSASDANRFAIRLARYVTGRKYVLVFNWCYHGSVDESFATLDEKGKVQHRVGQVGPPVHPSHTTKVVEWNDVAALEAALAPGDVACVLAEPAMTNIGIIMPQPGYLAKLQELTQKTGTLLIIDETHTMSAGPGGMTGEEGLKPDMLTIGKAIGGGIPCGA